MQKLFKNIFYFDLINNKFHEKTMIFSSLALVNVFLI